MSNPVHQIETWTGAVKDYTITDAHEVYFKEIITDGIGNFHFIVGTRKDDDPNYYYGDIAIHDLVKIWLRWDSITGNPDFTGRVANISAPLSTDQGYVRVISGLSQGEILLRRLKTNKYYNGTPVKDIIIELAGDLGLNYQITVDNTPVYLEVQCKNYFDLLREISDYWYNAGTQIKKDFYVNPINELVWKLRPLRSTGVESFTVGSNIDAYTVMHDVDSVRNNIKVYGAAETTIPLGIDDWTESLTGWSGNVQLNDNAAFVKFGSYSIQGIPAAQHTFKRVFPRITTRNVNMLKFWRDTVALTTSFKVRLHAPDSSHYFETDLTTAGSWKLDELSLGPTAEYHVDKNPNGIWHREGSPNWWDLQAVEFTKTANSPYSSTFVDGLWFFPERWTGTASDLPSSYGQRDLEATDEKLHSNTDCTKRAQTLLYQRKDPPIQIDLLTKGSSNLLAGDRVTVTIPAEGITIATPFDVLSVEQWQTLGAGFQAKAVMVNSESIRSPVENEPLRIISSLKRQLRAFVKQETQIS